MQIGPGIVQADDFLTREECARISEKVLFLQSHWEPRLGLYQFATLGCAAYLDAGEALPGSACARKSGALNPILGETFQEICERIRLYFCEFLDAEVFCDNAYAYPGFHLFQFDGDEMASEARVCWFWPAISMGDWPS